MQSEGSATQLYIAPQKLKSIVLCASTLQPHVPFHRLKAWKSLDDDGCFTESVRMKNFINYALRIANYELNFTFVMRFAALGYVFSFENNGNSQKHNLNIEQ